MRLIAAALSPCLRHGVRPRPASTLHRRRCPADRVDRPMGRHRHDPRPAGPGRDGVGAGPVGTIHAAHLGEPHRPGAEDPAVRRRRLLPGHRHRLSRDVVRLERDGAPDSRPSAGPGPSSPPGARSRRNSARPPIAPTVATRSRWWIACAGRTATGASSAAPRCAACRDSPRRPAKLPRMTDQPGEPPASPEPVEPPPLDAPPPLPPAVPTEPAETLPDLRRGRSASPAAAASIPHLDREPPAQRADAGHLFGVGQGAPAALLLRPHLGGRRRVRLSRLAGGDSQGPPHRLRGDPDALRRQPGGAAAGQRALPAAGRADADRAGAGVPFPRRQLVVSRHPLRLRWPRERRLPRLPAAAAVRGADPRAHLSVHRRPPARVLRRQQPAGPIAVPPDAAHLAGVSHLQRGGPGRAGVARRGAVRGRRSGAGRAAATSTIRRCRPASRWQC